MHEGAGDWPNARRGHGQTPSLDCKHLHRPSYRAAHIVRVDLGTIVALAPAYGPRRSFLKSRLSSPTDRRQAAEDRRQAAERPRPIRLVFYLLPPKQILACPPPSFPQEPLCMCFRFIDLPVHHCSFRSLRPVGAS